MHWASASRCQAWEDGRVIWSSPAAQVKGSLLTESGNVPVRRGLRSPLQRNAVNLEESELDLGARLPVLLCHFWPWDPMQAVWPLAFRLLICTLGR